jgi:hypothetical protein
MSETVFSQNGIPIRLTGERWEHIMKRHAEMIALQDEIAETIRMPERIMLGNDGEYIALRALSEEKYLVVMYRELELDGFIITAFTTRKFEKFFQRQQIWPP